MEREMTRQNTKLLIMFIIGLPSLPLACVAWLLDRYIVAYDLPPEKRMMHTKEHFIAMMCALTMFIVVYGGMIMLAMRCDR
jgi:hypothetical protein